LLDEERLNVKNFMNEEKRKHEIELEKENNSYIRYQEDNRSSYKYAISCALGSTFIFVLLIFLKYFYGRTHSKEEHEELSTTNTTLFTG
jgi:hypothetical protein